MIWKKKRYHWLATIVLTVVQCASVVQADPLVLPRLTPDLQLSQPGDLASILLAQAGARDSTVVPETVTKRDRKSPGVAALMSAILPGSGEFWAGSKTRAVMFFGLEVLGVATDRTWESKGEDLEDEFRVRADSTYNPWNYLAWRDSRNSRFSSITHALPCSAYVKAAPSSVPVPDAIANCPGSDKQQFYELIGKYDQFVSGWDDVYDNETGNRVESTEVDSAENFQSATRLSYEVDRNESNKYLKRASTIQGLRLVNHVFSAIDAARVARARNEGQDEAVIDRRTRFGVAMGGSVGTTPMFMAYRPME
ncbi:MAG: hypothetical protein O2782_01230 [bacterium]|nr:hypothetical protein [bacterium]